jgi:hypothetical protein
MEFAVFPPNNWSAFGRLNESVAEIDKKCLQIVEKIKEAFEKDSLIGANVCSIEIAEGSQEIALIKSPVGNGRIVQGWTRSERELKGTLVFQREQFDKFDRRNWETIWAITVPRYEDAFSGTGEVALHFDLDGFSGDPRRIAFAAAISILAGLVDGPARSTAQ